MHVQLCQPHCDPVKAFAERTLFSMFRNPCMLPAAEMLMLLMVGMDTHASALSLSLFAGDLLYSR